MCCDRTDGLRLELERAGFEVTCCLKLTTGGRALAFLIDRHGWWMHGPKATLFGLLMRGVRRALSFRRAAFHAWCDDAFRENRMATSDVPGHSVYVALLAVGVRPAGRA